MPLLPVRFKSKGQNKTIPLQEISQDFNTIGKLNKQRFYFQKVYDPELDMPNVYQKTAIEITSVEFEMFEFNWENLANNHPIYNILIDKNLTDQEATSEINIQLEKLKDEHIIALGLQLFYYRDGMKLPNIYQFIFGKNYQQINFRNLSALCQALGNKIKHYGLEKRSWIKKNHQNFQNILTNIISQTEIILKTFPSPKDLSQSELQQKIIEIENQEILLDRIRNQGGLANPHNNPLSENKEEVMFANLLAGANESNQQHNLLSSLFTASLSTTVGDLGAIADQIGQAATHGGNQSPSHAILVQDEIAAAVTMLSQLIAGFTFAIHRSLSAGEQNSERLALLIIKRYKLNLINELYIKKGQVDSVHDANHQKTFGEKRRGTVRKAIETILGLKPESYTTYQKIKETFSQAPISNNNKVPQTEINSPLPNKAMKKEINSSISILEISESLSQILQQPNFTDKLEEYLNSLSDQEIKAIPNIVFEYNGLRGNLFYHLIQIPRDSQRIPELTLVFKQIHAIHTQETKKQDKSGRYDENLFIKKLNEAGLLDNMSQLAYFKLLRKVYSFSLNHPLVREISRVQTYAQLRDKTKNYFSRIVPTLSKDDAILDTQHFILGIVHHPVLTKKEKNELIHHLIYLMNRKQQGPFRNVRQKRSKFLNYLLHGLTFTSFAGKRSADSIYLLVTGASQVPAGIDLGCTAAIWTIVAVVPPIIELNQNGNTRSFNSIQKGISSSALDLQYLLFLSTQPKPRIKSVSNKFIPFTQQIYSNEGLNTQNRIEGSQNCTLEALFKVVAKESYTNEDYTQIKNTLLSIPPKIQYQGLQTEIAFPSDNNHEGHSELLINHLYRKLPPECRLELVHFWSLATKNYYQELRLAELDNTEETAKEIGNKLKRLDPDLVFPLLQQLKQLDLDTNSLIEYLSSYIISYYDKGINSLRGRSILLPHSSDFFLSFLNELPASICFKVLITQYGNTRLINKIFDFLPPGNKQKQLISLWQKCIISLTKENPHYKYEAYYINSIIGLAGDLEPELGYILLTNLFPNPVQPLITQLINYWKPITENVKSNLEQLARLPFVLQHWVLRGKNLEYDIPNLIGVLKVTEAGELREEFKKIVSKLEYDTKTATEIIISIHTAIKTKKLDKLKETIDKLHFVDPDLLYSVMAGEIEGRLIIDELFYALSHYLPEQYQLQFKLENLWRGAALSYIWQTERKWLINHGIKTKQELEKMPIQIFKEYILKNQFSTAQQAALAFYRIIPLITPNYKIVEEDSEQYLKELEFFNEHVCHLSDTILRAEKDQTSVWHTLRKRDEKSEFRLKVSLRGIISVTCSVASLIVLMYGLAMFGPLSLVLSIPILITLGILRLVGLAIIDDFCRFNNTANYKQIKNVITEIRNAKYRSVDGYPLRFVPKPNETEPEEMTRLRLESKFYINQLYGYQGIFIQGQPIAAYLCDHQAHLLYKQGEAIIAESERRAKLDNPLDQDRPIREKNFSSKISTAASKDMDNQPSEQVTKEKLYQAYQTQKEINQRPSVTSKELAQILGTLLQPIKMNSAGDVFGGSQKILEIGNSILNHPQLNNKDKLKLMISVTYQYYLRDLEVARQHSVSQNFWARNRYFMPSTLAGSASSAGAVTAIGSLAVPPIFQATSAAIGDILTIFCLTLFSGKPQDSNTTCFCNNFEFLRILMVDLLIKTEYFITDYSQTDSLNFDNNLSVAERELKEKEINEMNRLAKQVEMFISIDINDQKDKSQLQKRNSFAKNNLSTSQQIWKQLPSPNKRFCEEVVNSPTPSIFNQIKSYFNPSLEGEFII